MLEALPVPLGRALGDEMGAVMGELHRDHGVEVRLGTGVAGFEAGAGGRVERVRLADGGAIDADLVVVGIGVTPNTGWLEGSGLAARRRGGVRRHDLAAPGVVAAGDVARWPSHRFGELMRVEHWDNAIAMGEHAARRLLADLAGVARGPGGAREPYDPVPWFWSDQYDRKVQLAGRSSGADEVRVVDGDAGRAALRRPVPPGRPAGRRAGHEPAPPAHGLPGAGRAAAPPGTRRWRRRRRVTAAACPAGWPGARSAAGDRLGRRPPRQPPVWRCVAKPLTMVVLIGAAVALDPADPAVRLLVRGGAAAVAGGRRPAHAAPRPASWPASGRSCWPTWPTSSACSVAGVHAGRPAGGPGGAAAAFVLVGTRLLAGVRAHRAGHGAAGAGLHRRDLGPGGVPRAAPARRLAIAGAVLFYVSDSLIGRQRFVEAHERGDTAVMVTYHLAQILLVLSLM